MKIQGNIIDVVNRKTFFGEITVENSTIVSVIPMEGQSDKYIMPGFVDAHVHIESSMLIPSEFARLAVLHGSVATVSDPHEIANVLGIDGVKFMIENGNKVPFKFYFGAPSCVPATTFESAGAVISVEGVEELLQMDEIHYLAEMMNYPGVLFKDKDVIAKLALARKYQKPIDGHAPGLRGEEARKYAAAGISTDHECFTYEEAEEKIGYGMKILIREGSAAKNFEALIDLLPLHPDKIMFCSDDKHPDDLILGHINQLVARALKKGCELFDVLHAACIAPVRHYNLQVGLLQSGDSADFIVVNDIENFEVHETYIDGVCVAKNKVSLIERIEVEPVNNFNIEKITAQDLSILATGKKVQVIEAIDGEIVTQSFTTETKTEEGFAISNTANDILKMAVINRYEKAPIALAFIKNFGFKSGAIASCVGHDSHNIIAVGTTDEEIAKAVNLIIENKGGISAVSTEKQMVLPLPVAGIMTNDDAYEVSKNYAEIDAFVKSELPCGLTAPFMTLSFMALLVIPQLKLSDKGLFDGKSFKFTSLFLD